MEYPQNFALMATMFASTLPSWSPILIWNLLQLMSDISTIQINWLPSQTECFHHTLIRKRQTCSRVALSKRFQCNSPTIYRYRFSMRFGWRSPRQFQHFAPVPRSCVVCVEICDFHFPQLLMSQVLPVQFLTWCSSDKFLKHRRRSFASFNLSSTFIFLSLAHFLVMILS